MSDQTIAHYRIIEKLGEGGMGVVYKARDTHLDRFVALKLLPPERIVSPERRARFVQEAKAASALNHPNIITIHDIGNDAGRDYIAMEFVAGKTLDQLIPRKGLRLSEALKIGVQIADALSRAHEAGIIHRDLKPANVMVDQHGHVKVLDFGLAKLTERESGEFASTATIKPHTEEGAIVGTVGYMSPEQAEAKPLDARSDIFSFGSLLYEMVTGRRAFHGDSKLSTLAAILRQEPAPLQDVPPELEKIIARCLRKDPERRAQHMADVKLALLDLKEESDSGKLSAPATALPAGARHRRRVKAAGMTVVVLAAAAGLTLWLRRPPSPSAPAPMMRLTSDSGLTTDPALSPDGRLIAYASDRAGGDDLDIWVQQVDGRGSPLRLTTDPANESDPCFSPDGNQIVFRSERDGGGIYSIPALGGEPRLIAKGGRQPRFSPDGSRISFVVGRGGAGGLVGGRVHVIASAGGAVQPVESGEVGAASPTWSPDGRFILFATGFYRPDDWGVVPSDAGPQAAPIVLPLAALKKAAGLADVFPYAWTTGNRILFSAKSGDSSHLFEIGLSPPGVISKSWRLEASPRRLTSGTELEEKPALAGYGAAAGARRLAFASLIRSENLWSLSLDTNHPGTGGKLQRVTEGSGFQIFPTISRDGTKLAYISHAAYNDEVWLMNMASGKRILLSTQVSVKYRPLIHADGSRVLWDVASAGVYAVSSTGGASEKLCDRCGFTWDWSGDHKRVLHFARPLARPGGPDAVCRMVNLETGKSQDFLARPGWELYQSHWSPDGRWIVFLAFAERQRTQVYVVPFTGDQAPGESAWIPVTDGSSYEDKPYWSPDGNWIYALSDRDGYYCLWALPVDPLTKRPAGTPRAVFHSHTARLSLRNANLVSQELAIARDKIVFNQGEVTGNIWVTSFNPD